MGYQESSLFYLDPHHVRPAVPFRFPPASASGTAELDAWLCRAYGEAQLATYHCERVRRMPLKSLDPSMLMGFVVSSEASLDDFRARVQALPKPLFSVAENPPRWAQSDNEEEDELDLLGMESFSEGSFEADREEGAGEQAGAAIAGASSSKQSAHTVIAPGPGDEQDRWRGSEQSQHGGIAFPTSTADSSTEQEEAWTHADPDATSQPLPNDARPVHAPATARGLPPHLPASSPPHPSVSSSASSQPQLHGSSIMSGNGENSRRPAPGPSQQHRFVSNASRASDVTARGVPFASAVPDPETVGDAEVDADMSYEQIAPPPSSLAPSAVGPTHSTAGSAVAVAPPAEAFATLDLTSHDRRDLAEQEERRKEELGQEPVLVDSPLRSPPVLVDSHGASASPSASPAGSTPAAGAASTESSHRQDQAPESHHSAQASETAVQSSSSTRDVENLLSSTTSFSSHDR